MLAFGMLRFLTRTSAILPVIVGAALATTLAVLLGAPVGAQQAASAAVPTVPTVLIAPGDSTLRGNRIAADSVQYSLIAYRGEQQQVLGTAVDVVKLEMRGDVPVIHRVLTVSPGQAPLIDSTVTDARTMAPRGIGMCHRCA